MTSTTMLVLHGGGGPATVAPLAHRLAERPDTTVLSPTHPGWQGSTLDPGTTIADLARRYLTELGEARDVVVVGSSIGGWIALEMALGDDVGRVGSVVLVDSVGVDVPGHPITPYVPDLDAVPAERRAQVRANRAALSRLAGDPYMHDPTLLGRLGGVTVPTLVLWGGSDTTVGPGYGAALAAAIPGAHLEVLPGLGHLPHLEDLDTTTAAIEGFLASLAR